MIDRFLTELTELSHKYGSQKYVKGGGGNSSYKNETSLWVKPSGSALAIIKPEDFIPLERSAMQKILEKKIPEDPIAREATVKELMLQAVKKGIPDRPSVEALLHHIFSKSFVLHVHPEIINAMTCAIDGKNIAKQLFPDSLWVPYVDPGYTLSKTVFSAIHQHKNQHKNEPELVFLENHGVFIAGDSPEKVSKIIDSVMETLENEYKKAGLSLQIDFAPSPHPSTIEKTRLKIHELSGNETLYIKYSPPFPVAQGPLTPDHIVYAKSFAFKGKLNKDAFLHFKQKYGYLPRVLSLQEGVFATGLSEKSAELAMELAMDGALIKKLAEAFGGVKYLNDPQRLFIENWEVESYRAKQIK
jgi:rhamnose utilization protein RhaD (predicted bifunctional aldolase and dehydrogenase)